jgi:acetyl-CoA acetyltransferase
MAGPDVVISGVGQSAVGRRLARTGLGLTVDAVLAALDDAGLKREQIDGIATYPGRRDDMLAFSPVGSVELKEALGLQVDWFAGGLEGPAQLSALINAYIAIKSGLVKHVVCFRTVKEGTGGASWRAQVEEPVVRKRVDGEFQWLFPFKALAAVNWLAPYAQRHFHLYGTTREQLAQIALNARRNGQRNPKAIFREPLTLDDYLGARMISSPLCLFDCDAPTDGSTAIILSSAEAASDLKSTPVRVDSVGASIHGRASWDQADIPATVAFDAAAAMWSRTDFKPKDVDVAELYDGFSILTLLWLEALGFCKVGESGAFVADGKRIALDGDLPLNTHGGQLSAGRTHGFGFVHEAVLQLRGQAGARQVANSPKVAVAAAGGGPMAGCMLLAR